MSLALARKYRPRSFATVAVQSHVANTLKGAIARDRVANGYLLCGPRGTGKTTLARVLAMALNCERRGEPELQGEPCGQCDSCQRIWSGGASLDVMEMDAASNRGVEDARNLRERAMYAPSGDDRYKVYIVDEAHMLTKEAWNTLLKILEEPPPRVVFVFATTEPQKIAQAAAPILSRLQRFDLKRIGPAEIRERLSAVLREEGVTYEEEAVTMLARAADGGLRDALSLTDQVMSMGDVSAVTAERVREALGLIADDEYLHLLDLVAERRAAEIFPAMQRLADSGVDFALLMAGLGDLLRAQLALALGGVPPELPERLIAELTARKGRHTPGDLLRMLHALLELEPLFRKSGHPRLLLETLLVRMALLDRTVALEEVLKGFGDGGREDPPVRRAAHEPRVAGAHALPPAPPAAVAPALTPGLTPSATRMPPIESRPVEIPVPRPATQQVAQAAAAAQLAPQERTRSKPTGPVAPPTLDAVRAAWPEVAEQIRRNGRGMVAQAVQRLQPVDVTATGMLVLSYASADDTWAQAVESAKEDVLAATQRCLAGVTALTLRTQAAAAASDGAAGPRPTRRLTAEDVQQERLEQLMGRDPLLAAAVHALDLELRD